MLGKFLQKTEDLIKAFKEELFRHELDENVLLELLETKKFSINHQDKKGNTFLHYCIMKDKFKSALWLIEQGADLEIENINNISPIFLLIEKKHYTLLEIVLEKKLVKVDKKDNFGRTLLQNAVVLGYSEVAQLFIQYGADINSKDNNNRHVLFDALSFGDKKFIKHLLSCDDLELNVIDKNQDSIMHHPQVRLDDENAIGLLEAGADATIKNKEGETFLCTTALRGIEAEEVVKTAIKTGNDINSRVKNNNSILMELVAASSKLTEAEKERRDSLLKVSKVLIQKGIDVNAVDNNNETALFRAVRDQDVEQVGFLLSAGVDPNVVNNNYETVFTIAVFDGIDSLDIILLLLKHGVDPSIKNHKKQTTYEILNELVLHTHNKKLIEDKSILERINVSGQYLIVLKEILSHSKDQLDFYDSKGNPLFFEPLLEDHFPMFKIYLQNGLNIHRTNVEGYNLFYKYVVKVFEEDNEDIDFQNNLSLLLSKKVDHNAQDHTGYTVLHKIMHTRCNITLFDILTKVVLFNYKVQDNLGRSVIHTGVWNDQRIIMKRIHNIDKNSVNITDSYGILPITYAALLGNKELVLLFLEMKANIRSKVKIAPQAVEKFRPMLKNLKKLEYGITNEDTMHKVKKVIDQVNLDFSDHKQKMYEFQNS